TMILICALGSTPRQVSTLSLHDALPILWGFLYLPTTSPLNWVLEQLGLPGVELLSGSLLYPAIANIAVWTGVGFNMIIIYTSLRSEEHTSELQSRFDLVCRLLLEKKKKH